MQPEDSALAKFRHYTPGHRCISWVSRNLFAHITYRQRHGLIRGMKRRGGLGFVPRHGLTPEESFLESLSLEGKVVYDIGAFEGLLTLFFARRGATVVAFEPNPANARRCVENLRLNGLSGSVRLVQEGVSDATEELVLHIDSSMPGGGSADPLIVRQIQLQACRVRTESICVLPLDAHIAEKQLAPPDLVKIDIEGMEYSALCGMRKAIERFHPELYIEMHGATPKEKRENWSRVLRFLRERDYEIYDVERNSPLNEDGDLCPSHIYCGTCQLVTPLAEGRVATRLAQQ